jgi:hypothetical protein
MAGVDSQDIPQAPGTCDKGVLGAMRLILASEQRSLISVARGYIHWLKGIMNAFLCA